MILNPYGKSLFKLLSKQFNYLRFEVRDSGAKESVSVFISESMKEHYPKLKTKRQLATIQYKGGTSKILNGEIDGVVLRFYIETCMLLKIDNIIELAQDYRSPLMSPDKERYYNYTYTEINSYTINHIVELFDEVEFQLKHFLRMSMRN